MELVAEGIDFVRYVRSVDTFEEEPFRARRPPPATPGPATALDRRCPRGAARCRWSDLHAALPQVVAGVLAHSTRRARSISDIKPENVLVTRRWPRAGILDLLLGFSPKG